MDGDSDADENVFLSSSISYFKVSIDKQSLQKFRSIYIFTEIVENPKSNFREIVIKFQNS